MIDKEQRKEVGKVTAIMLAMVFFAVIGNIFVACSPRIAPPAEIRDSVRVEIRERLVHDSVYFEVPVEKEVNVTRDTVSHLENSFAESDAEISGGFLRHTLSSRPQRIYVPYTVEIHDTTIVEHQAETIIQKENYVTKWQSFSMVLGWILGGLILLAAVLLAVKKFVFKL